jgi:hypothetical protein
LAGGLGGGFGLCLLAAGLSGGFGLCLWHSFTFLTSDVSTENINHQDTKIT